MPPTNRPVLRIIKSTDSTELQLVVRIREVSTGDEYVECLGVGTFDDGTPEPFRNLLDWFYSNDSRQHFEGRGFEVISAQIIRARK